MIGQRLSSRMTSGQKNPFAGEWVSFIARMIRC